MLPVSNILRREKLQVTATMHGGTAILYFMSCYLIRAGSRSCVAVLCFSVDKDQFLYKKNKVLFGFLSTPDIV